ncbi:PLP-dependent aminotransferase family protein [Nocardioides speluncae]|uniref:MocR-like pyridoxine biosynthesis transcription factor PdxR n=1 Tax=Nocardioides speluncae TaxID=2670337 RepID=UPI000D68E7DD|nr:PLP-dependent aminotransferase family protein [Nocardioides speluncae]
MPSSWSDFGIDLHLDVASVRGRRSALEAAIRDAIRAGRLARGTALPSTRVLAHQLGVARGTVTAAYDQLAAEGYLTARAGSGTTVAALPPNLPGPVSAGGGDLAPTHDLRPGRPDLSAFPVRAWLTATRRVLSAARPDVFGPGDPQGRIELRTAIADYLGRTRGVIAGPDRVVITSGYFQSLQLLGMALTAAGARTIAIEEPSHDAFRSVVRRSGLRTVPLPVDDDGAVVETLGAAVSAALLTPSHQYPVGVPLHPSRRQQVARWARATGGLVLEDDYDGEYRYDRRPVGALQGMASEHVAYCGTASKSLGPGLRLAWMVLPQALVGPVVRAKADDDQFTETLGQLVLADLITSHAYDRHIRASRLRYRRRREMLLERLGALSAVTAKGVPAGLHTLLALPAGGPPEAEVLAAAATRGLALRGLSELYDDHTHPRPSGLLVGFAAPSDSGYRPALDTLVAVLTEFYH